MKVGVPYASHLMASGGTVALSLPLLCEAPSVSTGVVSLTRVSSASLSAFCFVILAAVGN